MELSQVLILLPFFMMMAFLYGSAGHGGASGYLALFAIAGISDPSIAPLVLCLNIAVSALAFINFRSKGYFRARLLWPFVLSSVPAAFLGGYVPVSAGLFEIVLGLILLVSAMLILVQLYIPLNTASKNEADRSTRSILLFAIPAGAVIGFFSGMAGIGGGVFLTPVLILSGLAGLKHTAAAAAGFILLNSAAGLAGHLTRGNLPFDLILPFLAVTAIGGFTGSYLASGRFPALWIRVLTVSVLLIAAAKLLFV